jgi:hypothetical protein
MGLLRSTTRRRGLALRTSGSLAELPLPRTANTALRALTASRATQAQYGYAIEQDMHRRDTSDAPAKAAYDDLTDAAQTEYDTGSRRAGERFEAARDAADAACQP